MISLTISALAREDIGAVTDYYLAEAGDPVALGFSDALEAAISFIQSSPAAGSPRLRRTFGRKGIRVWPVRRYPYLVIYDQGPKQVLILRILHAARDIPASLRGPG